MTDFWKDKKILVYIALAHHTRFISPVVERLARQGAKIKYIIGQAERSQEITAITLGLDYTHVFDCVSDSDAQDVHENYQQLRSALSRCSRSGYLFSVTPVTVIDKTIQATAMEYVGFRNLLQKEKPDLCFALHELNRWGKMFAFWAKKNGIPVLTFQEGLYYGTDFGYTGHLQYSTFNLVWGRRVTRKLIDFEAPSDRVLEVGNTHLAEEVNRQKKNRIREKKRRSLNCAKDFVILLLFSGEIPNIDMLEPIFKVMAESKGKQLLIKFHPSAKHDQVSQWISRIPGQCIPMVKTFVGDENYYDLLSASDVCVIVQPSTTGLEALFFDKPLVHLDMKMTWRLPYSFTEFKVAAKMTPDEFAAAVLENQDFSRLTSKEDVAQYLDSELSDTKHAIETVIRISEKIVKARHIPEPEPIEMSAASAKRWSIIIQLPKDPAPLLQQLEAVAVHSENSGTFEVIMIEPDDMSEKATRILDTMAGDILRLAASGEQNSPEMMNRAAGQSAGQTLVFMESSLLPMENWLVHLDNGIKRYGPEKIYGARILDQRGSIYHSGIVIDKNNHPVSAFRHLPRSFSKAQKEAPFQMIDHVMAIDRKAFCALGGFWEPAGNYAFMDLCLRANAKSGSQDNCMYLPRFCLTALADREKSHPDHALDFYGKWQGDLWASQDTFLKNQNLTNAEIDTAILTQSMTTL